MKTVQLFAPDAASALAQVRAQLGPDAVVLSARPARAQGLARFRTKQRGIEIVAGLPDDTGRSPMPGARSALADFSDATSACGRWRSVAWLEAMGLLPANAAQLQSQLNATHASSPDSLDEEWAVVSTALAGFWKSPAPLNDDSAPRPHVLVGPPGCGKTTALCKWLTLASLIEGRSARVSRLDGVTANVSEYLNIHCEMLGVPLERFWSAPDPRTELVFVDLPGVEASDTASLAALRDQLAGLPAPRVHLVLNAAYEITTLLEQCEAFAALKPEDLILTHLDEERRRVKLWNLVFESREGIRFLGAGAKIPGEFCAAAPQLLFPES